MKKIILGLIILASTPSFAFNKCKSLDQSNYEWVYDYFTSNIRSGMKIEVRFPYSNYTNYAELTVKNETQEFVALKFDGDIDDVIKSIIISCNDGLHLLIAKGFLSEREHNVYKIPLEKSFFEGDKTLVKKYDFKSFKEFKEYEVGNDDAIRNIRDTYFKIIK
ncbi:MAG: hypothetical protein CMJ16_09560 [Peredibacter sp.]|nr:hypothetical protein [Peredibacter sp.]